MLSIILLRVLEVHAVILVLQAFQNGLIGLVTWMSNIVTVLLCAWT